MDGKKKFVLCSCGPTQTTLIKSENQSKTCHLCIIRTRVHDKVGHRESQNSKGVVEGEIILIFSRSRKQVFTWEL